MNNVVKNIFKISVKLIEYHMLNIFRTICFVIFLLFPKKVKICKDKVNEDIFILLNGPSLSKILYSKINRLKKKNCICVNFMALSKWFCELKPNYYIIWDPICSGVINFNILNEKTREEVFNLLNVFAYKIDWDITIFLPYASKNNTEYTELINRNKCVNVIYLNLHCYDGYKWLKKIFILEQLSSPIIQNIGIGAIWISLLKGFKNIYLLGADSNWLLDTYVDNENNLIRVDKHFYDSEKNCVVRKQQVIENGKYRKMYYFEELQASYVCFKEYKFISDLAKKTSSNIYNATPESFIDTFDRVDINQVLM